MNFCLYATIVTLFEQALNAWPADAREPLSPEDAGEQHLQRLAP
jgi:hypothetical protein